MQLGDHIRWFDDVERATADKQDVFCCDCGAVFAGDIGTLNERKEILLDTESRRVRGHGRGISDNLIYLIQEDDAFFFADLLCESLYVGVVDHAGETLRFGELQGLGDRAKERLTLSLDAKLAERISTGTSYLKRHFMKG